MWVRNRFEKSVSWTARVFLRRDCDCGMQAPALEERIPGNQECGQAEHRRSRLLVRRHHENDADENGPGDGGDLDDLAVAAEVPRAALGPAAGPQGLPAEIYRNDVGDVKPYGADGRDDGICSALQGGEECRSRRNPD